MERLEFERELFFSTPFSMGRRPMRQKVQAAPYVENRRWSVGGVVYATLNIQGSCNNLCDEAPDPDEYEGRNAANITWVQETFAKADKRHAAAVMFISQANVGWDEADPIGDHQANRTNDVNWLKVLVDPRSREVLSYEPQIVLANRVAVPAP